MPSVNSGPAASQTTNLSANLSAPGVTALQLSGALTVAQLPTTGLTYGASAYSSDQGAVRWNGSAWVPGDPAAAPSNIAQRRAANIANFLAGPKVVAPAWAATTAYAVGNCVQIANGQHIICSVAGTSGGTQPALSSTVLDGRPITDGSATWYCLPWTKSTSDINAPTITGYSSVAAASLTAVNLYNNQSLFKMYGALPVSYAASYIGKYTFAAGFLALGGNANNDATIYANNPTTWAYNCNDVNVEFYQTDSVVGIQFGNSSRPVVIEIDGVPLSGNPLPTSGTSGYTIRIDYSGVVKRRKVRIYDTHDVNIIGAAVTTLGYIETGDSINDNLMIFGDSIPTTIIPHPSDFSMYFPSYLQRLLGMTGCPVCAVSGTGYSPGGVVGTTNAFGCYQVISNPTNQILLPQLNPSHILFQAGYNDANGNPSLPNVCANALLAWQAARALFPAVKITVLDGMAESTGPDANHIALAAQLLATFNAWGDSNSKFVQTIGAGGNASWTNGTGNAGTAIAAGNSSNYIGTDATHPTPSGGYYLAQRCANAIIQAWNGAY